MALFKTIDLIKRTNAAVLISIILERGMMTCGKKADGIPMQVESEIKLGTLIHEVKEDNALDIETLLFGYCETTKGLPPELNVPVGWTAITRFFKDSRFVPKSRDKTAPENRDKIFQQRQEKSLVDAINSCNVPIHIENFDYKIQRAAQAPDFGPHGKENLVDVVVWDTNNFSYNVSCKMSKAADLGSGGLAGMKKTVPDLVQELHTRVQGDLYSSGFHEGCSYDITKIPSLMYCIPYSYAYMMFSGCAEVGGKIDYLYVGPDKVEVNDNKLNGQFWSVEQYAKKKPYYLRLRKRSVFNNTVKINFTKLNSYGLPCIFTSGAGDFSAARFVIDDRVTPRAIVGHL